MYSRTDAQTSKNHQRLELVVKWLGAIVRFIQTGATAVGRRVFVACQVSRRVQAAAVIRQYQHLIDEARAKVLKEPLETSGRPARHGAELKPFSTARNQGRMACLPY